MTAEDWWARGIALGSLGVSATAFVASRWDRRTRVWVYAHRAPDRTGGSIFQSAHASGIGPDDPVLRPPARENLYLIVSCNKETELSKAWFDFPSLRMDVESAQPRLPVRLLPHQWWHGWIRWRSVPNGVSPEEASTMGRAILTVTSEKIHRTRATPSNLLLGGNVPATLP